MRAQISIEQGGDLHERIKEYARERQIRRSLAYRQLIEMGLEKHEQE